MHTFAGIVVGSPCTWCVGRYSNGVLEKNVKTGYKTTQEYTLTDGLQGLIEKGIHVKGLKVENWYDCGQKDVLMQINALLLKRNRPKLPENLPHFENTIIVEPVYIGKNTVIKNSIIGIRAHVKQ